MKRTETFEELKADMLYEYGSAVWAVMEEFITATPEPLSEGQTLYEFSGEVDEISAKLKEVYKSLGIG